jgi:hypothetical protein
MKHVLAAFCAVAVVLCSDKAAASCWDEAGRSYGIDPLLLKAIAWKESRGWTGAVITASFHSESNLAEKNPSAQGLRRGSVSYRRRQGVGALRRPRIYRIELLRHFFRFFKSASISPMM